MNNKMHGAMDGAMEGFFAGLIVLIIALTVGFSLYLLYYHFGMIWALPIAAIVGVPTIIGGIKGWRKANG